MIRRCSADQSNSHGRGAVTLSILEMRVTFIRQQGMAHGQKDTDYFLILSRDSPNQSMKPTQHFVATSSMMHAFLFKVLGGLSPSR